MGCRGLARGKNWLRWRRIGSAGDLGGFALLAFPTAKARGHAARMALADDDAPQMAQGAAERPCGLGQAGPAGARLRFAFLWHATMETPFKVTVNWKNG